MLMPADIHHFQVLKVHGQPQRSGQLCTRHSIACMHVCCMRVLANPTIAVPYSLLTIRAPLTQMIWETMSSSHTWPGSMYARRIWWITWSYLHSQKRGSVYIGLANSSCAKNSQPSQRSSRARAMVNGSSGRVRRRRATSNYTPISPSSWNSAKNIVEAVYYEDNWESCIFWVYPSYDPQQLGSFSSSCLAIYCLI